MQVGSDEPDSRWVTVAFTWNGLQALGVNEASLATFPEEFCQGMAARAEMLGTTGANHPEHWVGGLASPEPSRDCGAIRPQRCGTRALQRRATRNISRSAKV